MPQYSEKKQKMYEAAEEYVMALNNCGSEKELEHLKEVLDILSAEYSSNPAYNALMKQKYIEKKVEIEE